MKKRWKDAKMSVKKKEATRKNIVKRTGGGPPPDIGFKPWELDVLSLIPEETISGIEGAVDTAQKPSPSENEAGCSSSSQATESSIVEQPFVIKEVELPEFETETAPEEPPEEGEKINSDRRILKPSSQKKKKAPKDQLMGELVEIKRRRVEIEERKALAFERIASALEMKKK